MSMLVDTIAVNIAKIDDQHGAVAMLWSDEGFVQIRLTSEL